MKRKIIFLVLVALAFAGAAYTLLERRGHDFTPDQCADCHATDPVKGKPETLAMKASLTVLCGRCHQTHLTNSVSHPTDVVPNQATPPPDLPLSWEGKVNCSTCHDIHAGVLNDAPVNAKMLRRDASGVSFCAACHVHDPQTAGSGGHIGQVGIAHMRYSADAVPGSKIDKVSSMCLSCHDGSVGGQSPVQVSSGSWQHGVAMSRYDPQGSHPIGIKYLAAYRRSAGGLRAPASLNPAIKLIDGRVGCPSCHDIYSGEKSRLVVANARLCTECHDK
jgi:predicted CXXCH cytochrome family protein